MSYLIRTPDADGPTGCRRQLPAGLRDACRLFEQFHCYPAWRVMKAPCRRFIPKLLVRVGELRGLIYSSDRGQPGCERNFVHFLEEPAELVCDPTGRQLYILGGNYRVTRLGIQG